MNTYDVGVVEHIAPGDPVGRTYGYFLKGVSRRTATRAAAAGCTALAMQVKGGGQKTSMQLVLLALTEAGEGLSAFRYDAVSFEKTGWQRLVVPLSRFRHRDGRAPSCRAVIAIRLEEMIRHEPLRDGRKTLLVDQITAGVLLRSVGREGLGAEAHVRAVARPDVPGVDRGRTRHPDDGLDMSVPWGSIAARQGPAESTLALDRPVKRAEPGLVAAMCPLIVSPQEAGMAWQTVAGSSETPQER